MKLIEIIISNDLKREKMKIIVINGSPKDKESNTNVMVESFLKGATKAGASAENIF